MMTEKKTYYRLTTRARLGLLLLSGCLFTLLPVKGQSAFEFITQNRNFSASNYCIYPDSVVPVMTPPPAGKKPFHISHYGRHGSRYLSQRKAYDIPYRMLLRADSLDELTPIGQDVLREMRLIISDSEGRWGDLTGLGKLQHRHIAQRMMERFPEVFQGAAYVDARSTTVNRCILSMGAFLQQMTALNSGLQVTMQASKSDMWYMNHQDKYLRDSMQTFRTKQAYDAFTVGRRLNPRLMELLFVEPDTVVKRGIVQEDWLNYYLLKTGLIQQNTHMSVNTYIIDLFTFEEIHRFWQYENAWWYFMYGPSPLNGGEQPYTQRYLLRKIIEDADSCIHLPRNGAMLRFGHETVVLPLVCLLGINGFDLQVEDLEELEKQGWWACLVFPMASNIQFVFYRSDVDDQDIIFKVLLNEQEASLPLTTDIAPYYHWKDFREFYLKKLDAYEVLRKSRSK
jgi:hypothetical protein